VSDQKLGRNGLELGGGTILLLTTLTIIFQWVVQLNWTAWLHFRLLLHALSPVQGQRVQYIHHWIAPILQDIGIICVLWTCIFLHRDSSNIQQVPIQLVQLLPNQGSPNKGYIIILLALIVGSNSHPTWLHQGFIVASCTCLISSNTKLLHYPAHRAGAERELASW